MFVTWAAISHMLPHFSFAHIKTGLTDIPGIYSEPQWEHKLLTVSIWAQINAV